MQKGAYSYFGVYVIHASVLIILAGVMMRLLFGFEGFVNIPEGETVSAVTIKGDGRMMKLDFAVRCDRFFIDFYENGAPKTYRSDLAFLKDGKAVQSSTLLVNHPVVFGGMRFYQAHYGKISGDDPVLSVMRNGNKIKDVKAAIGMTFDLPDHKATVQMVRVEEDLMGMGPAVKLNIRSSGGNVQFWVFEAIAQIAQANPGLLEQIPVFNPGLFKPYVFSLVQADHRYYTGLQVARDPGIPVVAAGALVMLIGFMIVFFSSHRQIRIRLDSLGDKTKISISGWSNRDAVGLDREIRYWIRAAGTDKEPRA
jgi:cytochrome c biogenesis protein